MVGGGRRCFTSSVRKLLVGLFKAEVQLTPLGSGYCEQAVWTLAALVPSLFLRSLLFDCQEHKLVELEQRVATLEREMSSLKARVTTVNEDVKGFPDLIKTEFRFTNSQIAPLSHDVAEPGDLPAKVEAIPRVVAELVVEMLDERDGKS